MGAWRHQTTTPRVPAGTSNGRRSACHQTTTPRVPPGTRSGGGPRGARRRPRASQLGHRTGEWAHGATRQRPRASQLGHRTGEGARAIRRRPRAFHPGHDLAEVRVAPDDDPARPSWDIEPANGRMAPPDNDPARPSWDIERAKERVPSDDDPARSTRDTIWRRSAWRQTTTPRVPAGT